MEQIHKIFKLCGSPSENYCKKSKVPETAMFKPQQQYRRCVTETFKDLPTPAVLLIDSLLSLEPEGRGTATSALQSEVIRFFFFFALSLPSLCFLYVCAYAINSLVFLEYMPQFFRAKPLACDPSSLPKLPPSKEYDVRLRQEEARRYMVLHLWI